MSSHTNRTEAHDFYYRGVDLGDSREYRGCTVSYRGKAAYSYSTVVAQVIPAKGFKDGGVSTCNPNSGITLVSSRSMSSTTCRHIGYLRGASPFPMVSVPMRRGDGEKSPRGLADMLYAELDALSKLLNTKGYREEFTRMLASLKRLRDTAAAEWSKPLRDRRFRRFLSIDVSKTAKAIQERNRKAAALAAKQTKEALEAFKGLHGAKYLELMHMLHCPWVTYAGVPPVSDRVRAALRRKLCAAGGAYVWLEDGGETVRTSKGVRVSAKEARVAMKLWASGKDMRAYRVGSYSVVSYQGGTIQIGCHKIPRENLIALYEAVIGEPFPKQKEVKDENDEVQA